MKSYTNLRLLVILVALFLCVGLAHGATAFLKVQNNSVGVLEGDITAIATTVVLETGDGAEFPAVFNYHISIDDEIMTVTNRVTDTLTVVRQAESTTGAAHFDGAAVELRITAKLISDLDTAVNTLEAGGFTGGLVEVGVDDTTQGEIYLYGAAATDGGESRWYNAGDEDGTVEYWIAWPNGSFFYIGSDVDTSELTIQNGGNVIADGDLTARGGNVDGAIDGTLTLQADTDLIFWVDADNDGTETFQWHDGAGTTIAEMTEVGALQLDSTLAVDGASMTSDDATFALLNVTPTTINLGAAADINMSALAKTVAIAGAFTWGGGYGATGGSALPTGSLNMNGALTVDGVVALGTASYDSVEPLIVASPGRTPAANSHGFVDESTIAPAVASGHNSFDADVEFTGSNNTDHHSSFQSRPDWNNSGTLGKMLGYLAQPKLTQGTVTDVVGLEVQDANNSGTITTQYGVWISEALTEGATNWAIYTEGATPSYFGGAMMIATGASGATANAGADVFVIEVAGNDGMSIINTDAGNSRIWFGSPSENRFGRINASYSGGAVPAMTFGTAVATGAVQFKTGDNVLAVLIDGNQVTSIGDGGVTNYAQFAADGELTLAGTARVKKEISIDSTSLSPGSTGPDAAILGNYIGYSYDIGDDSVGGVELPYDWASGTDLEVYIYWYINEAYATASGEVQWRVQWSATPTDASEAVDAPTHTGTIDYGDQNIPATAKYLTKTSAGTIAAASLASGDMLGFTIDRVALDGGTNPTADPVIVRIEFEFTSDKLGEAT